MPLYEYQALNPAHSCPHCCDPFEVLQGIHDQPQGACPDCGEAVRRIISRCHAAVMETSPEQASVGKALRKYEKSGKWGQAAELADKQAEKTKDPSLKTRALENYKKAGHSL